MDWKRRLRRFHLGGFVLAFVILLIVIAIYTINLDADLSHVDVKILSGDPEGNYYATVDRIKATAKDKEATVENVASEGTVANLKRLGSGCAADFAVVQDGVPIQGGDIELIGRLQRSEAVLIIGKNASDMTDFDSLRGKRIGIGPVDSGTNHLARSIFGIRDFTGLAFQLINTKDMQSQLDALARDELELGVFVMDDDSDLARKAIRDMGLQLAPFAHLRVLANRLSSVSIGTIPAGQYSATSPVLPAQDVPVLRVNTLIVGNGCASRSEVIGLLSILSQTLPGFIASNQIADGGQYPANATAREFLHNEGPGWADEHVPWLVDIMPLGNWIYVAMAISLLFNGLTLWHRVRLWRIDANRDKANEIVRLVLGNELTPNEILELEPREQDREPGVAQAIDVAIEQLDKLRIKTRKQENSWLVPLAQEWIYRYEEEQMEILVAALRKFRKRLGTEPTVSA